LAFATLARTREHEEQLSFDAGAVQEIIAA